MTVQKRLQKRIITFCRALQGLQPGKSDQKALGALSETTLRKPGFCMVEPTFTSLSPPDSRFEDPQRVLKNLFYSDFLNLGQIDFQLSSCTACRTAALTLVCFPSFPEL